MSRSTFRIKSKREQCDFRICESRKMLSFLKIISLGFSTSPPVSQAWAIKMVVCRRRRAFGYTPGYYDTALSLLSQPMCPPSVRPVSALRGPHATIQCVAYGADHGQRKTCPLACFAVGSHTFPDRGIYGGT